MGGVLFERLSSGSSLSYNDYDNQNSNSNVSSHLCKMIITAQALPLGKK